MQDTPERTRRRWADIIVIATALLLLGLAAWNAPASVGRPDETASLASMYVGYGIGGALALLAVFITHRWRMAGRLLVVAAALLLLGFGFDAFSESATGPVWLTVLLPALLLLGAAPFFGPMPRARPG